MKRPHHRTDTILTDLCDTMEIADECKCIGCMP